MEYKRWLKFAVVSSRRCCQRAVSEENDAALFPKEPRRPDARVAEARYYLRLSRKYSQIQTLRCKGSSKDKVVG